MSQLQTEQREIAAMQEAMSLYGLKETFIVAGEDHPVKDVPKGIKIIPAWFWFLNSK